MIMGSDYGKKFIVDDIQKNRITQEDLLNMNDDELYIFMKKGKIFNEVDCFNLPINF